MDVLNFPTVFRLVAVFFLCVVSRQKKSLELGPQESLVLFDRAGGLPHIALQLPVPPKHTLPKEAGDGYHITI